MRFKTPFLYLILVSLSLSAAALTLGRARGAAWIGMPLDLSVAAQMESEQHTGGLCAEADVFYADTKIESARVQVSVVQSAPPDGATIRIRSSVPVDEPVVTVYLRAGCAAKSTRRFVLLADYPTDSAPAAAPSRVAEAVPSVEAVEIAAVVPTAPAASPSPVASQPAITPAAPATPAAAQNVSAPPIRPVPQTTTPTPKPPTPSKAEAVRKPEPVAKPGKPATNGGARLKLDPLENLTERIKSLEASTTSTPVQEMVQDSARIAQLQGDVKALLEQAAKNEASLAAMRERLEKAEAEQQFPQALVYLLFALLAASAVAIYALWRRRTPELPRADSAMATNVPVGATPVMDTSTKAYQAPVTEHVDLDDLPFEKAVAVVEPIKDGSSDFMALAGSVPSHFQFNAEKILDLCQQAVFMQSLGKTDEAIALLETRIRRNAQDCPLVYLQLLDILQSSARNTDFRVVRDGFMQRFNCNVPEFSAFREEGKSLEAYPGTLSHITQLWNSPQAIEEIESSVIRRAPDANATRFDLAAFRELLMLHGLAQDSSSKTRHLHPSAADSEHINLDF